MREILVYDDYEIHKLGAGGGTQYEEVTTEKATQIYVTDVAKPKGKLIPFGRTEQDSYIGRNLLPIVPAQSITQNGITLESYGDGSYRVYGTNTAVVSIDMELPNIIQLPNETLYWHIRNNVANSNVCLALVPVGGGTQSQPAFSTVDRIRESTPLTNMQARYFGIRVTSSGQTVDITFTPSIELNNEVTDYEQYVGGQPSPSPDYPQPIENVEGNIIIKVANGENSSDAEYEEQTILFPLATGQKLMEGDYLADDGIHHVRGQMIVSNITNWVKSNNSNESTCLFLGDTNVGGGTSGTNIAKNCNKFISQLIYEASIINEGIFLQRNNGKIFIRIRNDRLTDTTVKAFKDWLVSNEVVLEYQLINETIDTYTSAQQEAYNKLKNLLLYKGVNHIWTNTDGLEPNLQLAYKRKKQSNVLQVSNVQPLNNLELNNTEETPEEITTEISEE